SRGDSRPLRHTSSRAQPKSHRPSSPPRRVHQAHGGRAARGHSTLGAPETGRKPSRYPDHHPRDPAGDPPRKGDATSPPERAVCHHRRGPSIRGGPPGDPARGRPPASPSHHETGFPTNRPVGNPRPYAPNHLRV